MTSKTLALFVLTLFVTAACGGGGSSSFTGDQRDNFAPVVNAGADATIRLPVDTVSLDGTVTDDGLPATGSLSTAWMVQSGPDGALFASVTAVDTDITFVNPGTYVLELTADDTELQTSDTVTVIVEAAPALAEISVTPASATLFTGGAQTFSAAGVDQYGDAFATTITWTATGGTINQSGEYVAGNTTGAFDVTATDGAVSGTAGVTIEASAPAADAGGPYSGAQGTVIVLDGSGSTDANDDIASYAWDLDNDGAYDDAVGVTTNFMATAAGVFTVGLQVTDDQGDSGIDTAEVTVTNVPPTANAGPDQAVAQGAAVALDGSGSSDVGGDVLTFAWTLAAPAGSAAVLSDPTAVGPGFVTDVAGSYVASLVVNDGIASSAADTVTITVSNVAPVADAGPDQGGVSQGVTVTLDGSGSSDVGGDALTYSWTLTAPAGSAAVLSDPTAVGPTFDTDVEGNYVAELVVNDGTTDSLPDTVVIAVGNVPPVADAGPDQTGVAQGATVTLDGSGSSDAGGDTITYAWTLTAPAGSAAVLSDDTAVDPTFDTDVAGDYVAELVVNDGTVDSDPSTVTITVDNVAPVANAGADQAASQGATVTLDGSGSSDAGGDTITYAWTLTAPAGSAAVLSDATAVGPTFDTDVAGSYVAELVVNDGTADSAPDTVTITVGNVAPVANAGPDQSGVLQGATVTLDGSASSDAGGDALTYAWTLTAPGGSAAVLSDATAVGPTFDTDVAGSYVAELIVNDGTVDSTADTVSITVDNVAPVADAGPDQSGVAQGATVTLDGSASSDAGGDALSYAWTLTAPGGSAAVLSSATAVGPTFDTDVVGSYVAELIVNDGTVDSAADTVTITVDNVAPVAEAGPDQPSVVEGATVTLDGSGSSDAGGDTLTYAWTLTAPAGSAAVLSDATAVGPTFDTDVAGSYVAELIVNDGTVDSAADTVTVTVTNVTPTANAGGPYSGDQGANIVLDGSASSDAGGSIVTYEWDFDNDTFFDDATGVSPTFSSGPSGTFTVGLKVTDDDGDSATTTATVTINDIGLAAYWKADEGIGTTTADALGTSNGTLTGTTWGAGVTGSALNFDGVDDFVAIDATPALEITGTEITLSAWIYPTNGGNVNGSRVISKRFDLFADDVYAMMLVDYRLVFRLDGSDMVGPIIPENDWTHVTMVYNGTDKRIYINGELDATPPQAKTDAIDASSRAVHIGSRETDADRFFKGRIDEAQVFDTALSPVDVAALFANNTAPPRPDGLYFTDITVDSGTSGLTDTGYGVMFAEVDNDSLPDIYVTNSRNGQNDRELLYDNTDGTAFTEVAVVRGADDSDGGSIGALFADLDNDGDYDIFNGTRWESSNNFPDNNNVLRNDAGVFTDVTATSSPDMEASKQQTITVTAIDWDGDGDLDLVSAAGDASGSIEKFRNNGGLNFTAIGGGGDLVTGVQNEGLVTATDYDVDGDVDLLMAKDDALVILQNDGLGIFTSIDPVSIGITGIVVDEGITTADIDNDGDLDLLLVGLGDARMFKREIGGNYSFYQGIDDVDGYMGGLADLDNDGDLDAVFAGDERYFYNLGQGSLLVSQSVPVSRIADARSIAFADIEGDGDLDFYIAADDSRNYMIRNDIDAAAGNWLRVELVSPQCQAGAFGAKTRVYAAGDIGGTLLGLRESKSSYGYAGQDDPVLHFGLGAVTSVGVEVTFLDGTIVSQDDVDAGQRILIDGGCTP